MTPKVKENSRRSHNIEANATVRKAVRLMNNREIGCLVVVQDGKPTGIVTGRDMLKRVLLARATFTQEVSPHDTEGCFDKSQERGCIRWLEDECAVLNLTKQLSLSVSRRHISLRVRLKCIGFYAIFSFPTFPRLIRKSRVFLMSSRYTNSSTA